MKKENRFQFPPCRAIILFFSFLAAFVLGSNLLKDDFGVVFKWWFALLVLGVAVFPISYKVFYRFQDCGYLISKVVGLAFISFILWTLSTIHILPFTRACIIILVILVGIACYVTYFYLAKKKNYVPFEDLNTDKICFALYLEIVFLVMFIGACYMKGFKVDISPDTEKYMDFGFMASMMRQKYLPAQDMWFGGESINYYYYGMYVATFITKFIGTTAGYGYNLDLMMIGALGFAEAYSIANELMHKAIDEYEKRHKDEVLFEKASRVKRGAITTIASYLTGFAVFAAGNFQYCLYSDIIPTLQKAFGLDVTGYWFPNATRFITDEYDGDVGSLIHEFPSYSFVLGDLHAHVCDIIFVLAIVATLLAFVLNRQERMEYARTHFVFEKHDKNGFIKEATQFDVLMVGFFIGIFQMTNFWDFPIYFIVSGAVILFVNATLTGFSLETVKLTAIHGVEVLLLGYIVAFAFNINFTAMSSEIKPSFCHSSLYELAVLWWFPIAVSVGLYIIAITKYQEDYKAFRLAKIEEEKKDKTKNANAKKNDTAENRKVEADYFRTQKTGKIKHLFSFIFKLEVSDLFILTIAACAAGLVLMPELVYVKDIYGSAYARSNTMFKLTYQSFILFGIVLGYAVTRLVCLYETKKQLVRGILCTFVLFWTFGYFGNAVNSWFGKLTMDRYTGLDSYKVIASSESEDVAATIEWVQENIEGQPIVAQMPTTSYGHYAIISAFTGVPSVIGWAYHEWLWRTSAKLEYEMPTEVQQRRDDMLEFYGNTDYDRAMEIINKYNIEYIYVGKTETCNSVVYNGSIDSATYSSLSIEEKINYSYYKGNYVKKVNVDHDFMKSLGTVVYDGQTEDLGYSTYIVKVTR